MLFSCVIASVTFDSICIIAHFEYPSSIIFPMFYHRILIIVIALSVIAAAITMIKPEVRTHF